MLFCYAPEDAPYGDPILRYDARTGVWHLLEDYDFNFLGHSFLVPAGFECDLSSVPRVVWSIMAPHELSIVAGLMHDWLYRSSHVPISRRKADWLFKEIMKNEGVKQWRWRAAYAAVRGWGHSSFQRRAMEVPPALKG